QKHTMCAYEKRIRGRAMAVLGRPPTRTAILDALEGLLGVLGYRKVTVDDVARAAGISRRTFYLHFPGKEEATLACLDRNIARLVGGLRWLARGPGSGRARLGAMLRFRVRFLHEAARHRRGVNDEIYGELRPLYVPRRERYLAAESAVFAEVLEEGRRGGELR